MKKVLSILCLLSTCAFAASPPFNYQGKLTDTNGIPYDGPITVALEIRTQDTGGDLVYSEEIGSLIAQGGLYAFHWGDSATTSTFTSFSELWLEIWIDDSPLTPRQRIVAVPYALNASTADALGSVLAYNDTAPAAEGAIRWNGSDFEGYDGTQWISLTGKGMEPEVLALIPAGLNEGVDPVFGAYSLTNEAAFYMDKTKITWSLWNRVRQWGLTNSYTDLPVGFRGSSDTPDHIDHPVTGVNWYDCIKWCNARSEMEGLSPCYYTNAAQIVEYRTGQIDLQDSMVDWSANGYRLPTNLEWEFAARGGLVGKEYPWGNGIDGNQANFFDSGDPYENGGGGTTPEAYFNGNQSPAGVKMVNGYGLSGMAGNTFHWIWNSTNETERVLRGGAWSVTSDQLRCGYRISDFPQNGFNDVSFRCVSVR